MRCLHYCFEKKSLRALVQRFVKDKFYIRLLCYRILVGFFDRKLSDEAWEW